MASKEDETPLEIPNLPEEIITEILSRLSVKTLLKLKCVSKTWRFLISSKHFIRAHLKNSTKNTTLAHKKMMIASVKPLSKLKQCSLPSLSCEHETHVVSFGHPILKWKASSIFFVGSCNGLICFCIDKEHFFLWNPATRESKKLPWPGDEIEHGFHVNKCGFGLDESRGDYKVYLELSWIDVNTPEHTDDVVKIYSLKTDSWRTTMNCEDGSYVYGSRGKYVNGKLHWIRNTGSNLRWDICFFDLKSENYGTIELPSCIKGDFGPALEVCQERLCVLCCCRDGLDLWIWKQDGVNDSWCKRDTISYSLVEKAPLSTQAIVYVESLVSLIPDRERERHV